MTENIYSRLAQLRVELQGKSLKKSGQNKFAGYSYYELGDFLPMANKLMEKYRITPIMSFDTEKATLTLVDVDNPSLTIEFTSPFGSANLKGCHEVQNIGATETYQRRYLYMVALEIVESDFLDGSDEPPDDRMTVDQEVAIENMLDVFKEDARRSAFIKKFLSESHSQVEADELIQKMELARENL